jgi:uncharacterized membrane protein
MARALAVMAVLWPLAQAASVAAAIHRPDNAFTALVRIVGARVCHRRPERSFHTAGVQWPVCARCSGLYLGAAIGVWVGFGRAVRRWIGKRRMTVFLILSSAPTVVTGVAEWGLGLPVTNVVRGATAIPLGAALGAAIVAVASSSPKRNQVN